MKGKKNEHAAINIFDLLVFWNIAIAFSRICEERCKFVDIDRSYIKQTESYNMAICELDLSFRATIFHYVA